MRTKKMITKLIAVTVSMAMLCPNMVLAETLEEFSIQEDDLIILDEAEDNCPDENWELFCSDTLTPDTENSNKEIALIERDYMFAPNIEGAQASNVYFGNYPQSSDNNGGFKVEPIKWRVLTNRSGGMAILADQILDAKQYHDDSKQTDQNYASSNLRKWLNEYDSESPNFINTAFNYKEIASLPQSGEKVFLLSSDDVRSDTVGFPNNDSRVATDTAYAEKQRASGGAGGAGNWWIQGQVVSHHGDYCAEFISESGIENSPTCVVTKINGVRPALFIHLPTVIFTSAAEGGKKSNSTGAGALKAVEDTSTTDWKLTVHDTTRDPDEMGEGGFRVVRTTDTELSTGAKYTIAYSGAQTGANEFVSAMITETYFDESLRTNRENVLYYGNIASCASNSSGTATINIPNDNSITSTCKLYVFQEQCNGDKKTDYSSQLLDWSTLTVKPLPTAADFYVTLPKNAVYDGKAKKATASGVNGVGTVTVNYYKDGTKLTGAPTEPGTYIVKLDAAEGEKYALATDITKDDWKFTIQAVYSVKADNDGHGAASASPTNAAAGTTVNLKATADNGYKFKNWTSADGVKFASATSATTTFTMPANNVTVKANFEKIPASKYSITVKTEGSGTAKADKNTAEKGEKVILSYTADKGWKFVKWQVVSGNVTINNNSFTMPGTAVEVKAVFEKDAEPEPKPTAKDISKATVTGIKNKTYTGKAIKQSPTVKLGGKTLKKGTDYTVSYKNNKNAGTATVTITGKGSYEGTVTKTFKIKKADNKLNVKAKNKTYSRSYSEKKKNEISGNDIYKFTKKNKTKGTIKYTLSSVKKGKKKVKKGFSVNKSNGKLTIKAGVAKGSYKITVKVSAGDKNYKTVNKDVKFTVEVK